MRELLQEGPQNALALALHADVPGTGLVSALFKHDLLTGRVVKLADGRYALNPDFDQALSEEIAAAIRLLKRHGYRVEKAARQKRAS